jgi:transcriptional regulator with XRE-family HTH domain
MGKRERAEDYFGKRLKAERERRGWSQSEMAKMLSDGGIPMHPTTIAKIESTEPRKRRSVKIDEAAGIADLLEVSLDSLLGRTSGGLQSDLAYTLRLVSDTAEQSSHQISAISNTLSFRLADLRLFEFEGREALMSEGNQALFAFRAALQHLHRVSQFEAPSEVGPHKDFVERHNFEVQVKNLFGGGTRVDETES